MPYKSRKSQQRAEAAKRAKSAQKRSREDETVEEYLRRGKKPMTKEDLAVARVLSEGDWAVVQVLLVRPGMLRWTLRMPISIAGGWG